MHPGLRLTVNINQNDYVAAAGDTAGLRVLVLGQNEMAIPEESGITVSPGCYTSIGIKQARLLVGVYRKLGII